MKKIILILMFFSTPVFSDPATGTVQVSLLSNIYTELKIQYGEMLKQLEEAKAASDTLNDVKTISSDLVKEYKFIQGFSLENEIASIKSDVQGLTLLDNITGDMTTLEKIELMNSELDRRVEADSNLTKEQGKKLKTKYAEMIRLKDLEDKKRILE